MLCINTSCVMTLLKDTRGHNSAGSFTTSPMLFIQFQLQHHTSPMVEVSFIDLVSNYYWFKDTNALLHSLHFIVFTPHYTSKQHFTREPSHFISAALNKETKTAKFRFSLSDKSLQMGYLKKYKSNWQLFVNQHSLTVSLGKLL